MKEHNSQSGHAITVSYSDFSFWCYECDSYIAHDIFRPLLSLYVMAPPPPLPSPLHAVQQNDRR
jgi:hypothetical protein